MKISDLGEFGLIDRIARTLPHQGEDVIVGIGDDVAVLRGEGNRVWLATCDVQMEGAHFMRQDISPRDLGRKALAINLSDIAAKGGTPRYALASLGLPKDLEVEFIDDLYAGLRTEAEEYGTEIIGGNISSSRLGIFIDIFLLGEAQQDDVLLRSGARIGDRILVTGSLGDAAAGVALMLDPNLTTSSNYADTARNRYHAPTPRVKEGALIAASHLASAMMDISDGLAGDLGHVCDSSGVSARVYAAQLPVAGENRKLALAAHQNEWQLALNGGEDYELLFTAPAANVENIAQELRRVTGTHISVIGEILPPQAKREFILPDGRVQTLSAQSWDHLRKENQ